MSSLAEFSRGVPIPLDEIRSALESVAIPGFSGVLQLEISPAPEAAQHVMIGVIRRQTEKVEPAGDGSAPGARVTRQQLPDPARKKPVQNVLDRLEGKLMIRTVVTAVEAHFLDGVLQKFTVQE